MQVRFAGVLGRAIVGAALSCLAACVTNSGSETAGVNPAQTAASFVPRPAKPGFGVAYIGRPADFHATYMPVPIELDGQPLASIGRGRYVRVELPPGPHVVSARDDWWSATINGKPHPAHLTVEPGKIYYLLPNRWAGEPYTTIHIVGAAVVPARTAQIQSSFSVQPSSPGAPPPQEFMNMTLMDTER